MTPSDTCTWRLRAAIVAACPPAQCRSSSAPVVEIGEDIAVHHEEIIIETVDQAERADGSQGLIFPKVVDRHSVARPVAEERFDQLGEVSGGDRDALESCRRELADHDIEDRPVADRHQRLWEHSGVWPQPGSQTAREYHGASHRGGSLRHGFRLPRSPGCRTTRARVPTSWNSVAPAGLDARLRVGAISRRRSHVSSHPGLALCDARALRHHRRIAPWTAPYEG